MTEQFGYTSVMQVPRIAKITLNMGVGEAVADKKVMEHAVGDMEKIAGQKAIVTKAKKSVAATGYLTLIDIFRCTILQVINIIAGIVIFFIVNYKYTT